MRAVEARRLAEAFEVDEYEDAEEPLNDFKPLKYSGKWPFLRVAGMQEVASVLFSLANLLAHVHNLLILTRAHRCPCGGNGCCGGQEVSPSETSAGVQGAGGQQPYPYMWLWTAYSCLHMNSWFWSAVFHSRDTYWTERLDYMSVDLVVAYSLFATLVRVFAIRSAWQLACAGAVVFSGMAYHMRYMLLVKFDYGWNVKVCVVMGVVQMAMWVLWCYRTRHPARDVLYTFVVLLHVAMLLEVCDFPPWQDLVDAHAAWHAVTVPLVYLFYRFLLADMSYVRGKREKDE